jgi:hypothetical protein
VKTSALFLVGVLVNRLGFFQNLAVVGRKRKVGPFFQNVLFKIAQHGVGTKKAGPRERPVVDPAEANDLY